MTSRVYSTPQEARGYQSRQGLIAIPNDSGPVPTPEVGDQRPLPSWLRKTLDRGGRFLSRWGLPLALLALALQAGLSLLGDSATFDETAHLVAGYTYLDRWDFRLNPEHPPLGKMWAAWPLRITGPGKVDYHSPHWASANQWGLGYEFLNGPIDREERRDPRDRLMPARLAMLGFGVALALVVYGWSKDLWGKSGGLLSLLLWTVQPAEEGLLCRRRRLLRAAVCLLGGGTLALGCLWACYGLRCEVSGGPDCALTWDRLEPGDGPAGTLIGLAKSARLLPEAYSQGGISWSRRSSWPMPLLPSSRFPVISRTSISSRGAPSGGARFLADSNLDWGQDLPGLKRWMDSQGVNEVHLAYFGTADPRAYGIRYKKVHLFIDYRPREATSYPRSGEYLAASVTLLQGLYAPDPVREFLGEVQRRRPPVGRAGDSIHIFEMP